MNKTRPKYPDQAEELATATENYYRDCNTVNNPAYDVKKARTSIAALRKEFVAILDRIASKAKVREEAEIIWDSEEQTIPKVGFIGKESQIAITIGLFRDYYLTTRLEYVNNLASMPDEFWQLFTRLQAIGKFEFKEEHKPAPALRKKHPQLFNKRGHIYKITRNFFLDQVEYGSCCSLGYISVAWENDTPADTLLANFGEAFKILYRINLMLWIAEQKSKK